MPILLENKCTLFKPSASKQKRPLIQTLARLPRARPSYSGSFVPRPRSWARL